MRYYRQLPDEISFQYTSTVPGTSRWLRNTLPDFGPPGSVEKEWQVNFYAQFNEAII